MALLLVGAATLPELFDAILTEYNLGLKYFNIEDAGKVLVRGVKDKGDIKGTSFLEDAYQLGISIWNLSQKFLQFIDIAAWNGDGIMAMAHHELHGTRIRGDLFHLTEIDHEGTMTTNYHGISL